MEAKSESGDEEEEDPVERINAIIANKQSIKFETVNGLSFLMYAIALMEEELAVNIIANGIDYDINESWDNGQTPLHSACQMDEIDVVNAIFTHCRSGINLYAVTNDFLLHFTHWECGGKSVLHTAAMHNNINICKRIVEFEYDSILKQQSVPRLLTMKDHQSNDVIDTALIYHNIECAKWLFVEKAKYFEKHEHIKNKMTEIEIDLYLRERMNAFDKNKKIFNDSKETKLRFESNGNNHEAMIDDEDILIIDKVWTNDECEYILNTLIKYGNASNWKSNRYQSFATTDIPLSKMHHTFDSFIRKEVFYKVYPRVIKHYKLENKFQIGPKYLFFVRYNDETEYRNTTDNFKQNSLNLHRDGSLISFNILLNELSEFEGGGTHFQNIDKTIAIERGDCCVHPGNILHCANGIIKGKRYVLVGFLNAKRITNPTKIQAL